MLIGIFYSQIVESSSLVSVLFREAISHPYISFFHLLVNGFSVISIGLQQWLGVGYAHELAVIPEAEPRDNRQRVSYFSA